MTTSTDISNREIVITRTLNAPRELVWKAWTTPEHVQHWWGPNGFTNTIHEMEVKPGGVWRFMMHGPDGTDYPNKIIFEEVVKPEKLVYRHSRDDENDPYYFRSTVTFEETGGKTLVTLRVLFTTAEERERAIKEVGAIEGGKQTLGRLDQYLTKMDMNPFTIERVYNVPREKVWNAITNKDEMKKWYFDLEKFDPTVGFEFQFYGEGRKGEKYLHLCKVTEVEEGKKLAYSWRYENLPGNSTVRFELFTEGEKTRLRLTHEGLESFVTDNPDFAKESFAQGWTEITGTHLKNYLESTGSESK